MHVGPFESAASPLSGPVSGPLSGPVSGPLSGPVSVRTPPLLSLCHVMAAPPALPETFVANEIRALRALGHGVLPVALGCQDAAMQPEDEALRAEAVSLAGVETLAALTAAAANPAGLAAAVGFAQRQRALPRRTLLRAAARLAFLVRERGCTHLHAHFAGEAAAVAICAARIAGITVSFTGHGQDLAGACTPGQDADLALKLAAADLVVAVSEALAAAFRRLAPHAAIRAIALGVAPERFRPLPGPGNGRLLAVGPLLPGKGFHMLPVALARLHPLLRPSMDVVGDGKLAGELAALAADLGVAESLRFLGARPSAWIAAEGPAYQGLVVPGRDLPDAAAAAGPLAMKEAMAMGLPVVAAALPGVREVVGDDCARLVAPGDLSALAEAMVWLASLDATARVRLGAAARARVQERFSLRRQAQLLASAFAALRA